MNTILNNNSIPLSDVLYTFSLEERRVNADLLDEYVCRFKEYAAPLTDFAIELAIDRLHDDCTPPAEAIDSSREVSPAVSRAISRFHNRLHQLSRAAAKPSERTVQPAVAPPLNPFTPLDRAHFRSLAHKLGVNSVLLGKLRDRLIEPATMPLGLLHKLAESLGSSIESLKAHFAAPPQTGLQFYKSDQKPEVVARQSFRDAVLASGLTEDEQRELLNL